MRVFVFLQGCFLPVLRDEYPGDIRRVSAAHRQSASQWSPGGRHKDGNDQTGGAGGYPGDYSTENREEAYSRDTT
jgi:hypothetical protein